MDNGDASTTAIVFPGISDTAYADLAKFLMLNKSARALVGEASEILGYHLLDRYKADDGRFTESSRVSFLVGCLALARDAEQRSGLRPDVVVGPSFGGMPAAVYAGAVGFADAVRMTAGWGACVERYFAGQYADTVSQSCARIPEAEVEGVLAQLREDGEWHDVACYVDTDFVIVSVRDERLPWLVEQLRARGGLPLATMRPPMHSPSFGALREEVADEVFARLVFTDPVLPMVDDHDGSAVETAEQVREMVLDGIVAPVRWPSVVAALRARGVTELVVAGQDSLWGRVRCSTDNFAVTTLTPRRALVPPARRLPAATR
ncbi:acyltransferase domain-containing protein [Streptomyces sp. NPDC005283]|uniref:ACP S-malonyltransferase n=1 Tax=unclassified Streptomyces TaxID=2593676 RepID=UPI0034513E39